MDLVKISSIMDLMEAVDHLFLAIKPDYELVFLNKAFLKRLGCQNQALIGSSGKRLLDKQDCEEAFSGSGNPKSEDRLPDQLPSLSLIWSKTYIDDAGEVVYGYLFKEQAKTENFDVDESQIKIILEAIVDSAVLIDQAGVLLGVNETVVRTFGYAREELLGKNVSMLMPSSVAKHHDGYLERYRKTGSRKIIGIGREVEGRKKDGSYFPVQLSVGELSTRDGKKVFIGAMADLTQRDALAAAESAAEAKDQFLANISHELRTPLNVILTFTQLLLSTALDFDQRKPLENILQAGRKLLHEVEQILDFSKLNAKKHHSEMLPFNLERCMRSIVAMQQPKDQPISIRLHIDKSTPKLIKCDPYALVTILTNLISNAVKFSRLFDDNKKQIPKVVSLKLKKEEGSSHIIYSVSDEGIGIDEEKQEHIFEEFSQEDISTTRLFGGTGLGLAIVHKIVQTLQGEINLQSEKGKGSVFSVSLPFEEVRDGEPLHEVVYQDGSVDIPSSPMNARSEQILVAEDDDFNMLALEGILIKLGFKEDHIHRAVNGWEALEKAREHVFDLILMDRQMPEMDGIEATRAIRKDSLNRETPIIALTAAVLEKSRLKCLKAGMNDFCGKPIHFPTLKNVLEKWLTKETDQEISEDLEEVGPADFDGVAFENALSQYGSDKLQRLIELAGQTFSNNLKKLSELIANTIHQDKPFDVSDWTSLHKIAHNLKGAPFEMIGGAKLAKLTHDFYARVCHWEEDEERDNAYRVEVADWFHRVSKAFDLLHREISSQKYVSSPEPFRKVGSQEHIAKILIADDDPSNLLFLQMLLQREGFEVVCAANGVDALHLSRIEEPDLLFLDVQMPGLSGFEVCQSLRQGNTEKQPVPVIFGTAKVTDDRGIARGFEVGGNDYISKPYTNKRSELVARIKTHLKLDRVTRKLKITLQQLKQAQVHLVDVAHHAGMADIASYILHNIGNVLNSVSVSSQVTENTLKEHEQDLEKISDVLTSLIEKFQIGGPTLQSFIEKKSSVVGEVLSTRLSFLKQNLVVLLDESKNQGGHIKMIKEYLNNSEKLAQFGEGPPLTLQYDVKVVLENIMSGFSQETLKSQIQVVLDCPQVTFTVQIIKFKIVLMTLIENAIASLKQVTHPRILRVACIEKSRKLTVTIDDTGVSLPARFPNAVFQQDFNSMGCNRSIDNLHMCINFAKQMEGALHAEHLPDNGARFIFELPIK